MVFSSVLSFFVPYLELVETQVCFFVFCSPINSPYFSCSMWHFFFCNTPCCVSGKNGCFFGRMELSQPKWFSASKSCFSADQVRNISLLKGSFLEQIFEIGLFDLDHAKHKAETVGSFCLSFSSLIKNCWDGCIGLFFQEQDTIIPSGFMEASRKSGISVRQLGQNWGSISWDAPSSSNTHHQDRYFVRIPLNLYFPLRLREHPNLYKPIFPDNCPHGCFP